MPEELVCNTVYFRNFKVPNIRNHNELEFRFVLDWIMCGLQPVTVIDFIGFLSSLVQLVVETHYIQSDCKVNSYGQTAKSPESKPILIQFSQYFKANTLPCSVKFQYGPQKFIKTSATKKTQTQHFSLTNQEKKQQIYVVFLFQFMTFLVSTTILPLWPNSTKKKSRAIRLGLDTSCSIGPQAQSTQH